MKIVLSTMMWLLAIISYAENRRDSLPVEVTIISMQHGDVGNKPQCIFKFYYDTVDESHHFNGTCFSMQSDKKESTIDTLTDSLLRNNCHLKPFLIAAQSDSVRLYMENYENDRGELCTYDKGDDYHYITRIAVALKDLMPGIYSDTMTFVCENFSAQVRIRVGLPQPGLRIAPVASDVHSALDTLKLSAEASFFNEKGIRYLWQYKKPSDTTWSDLGKTINGQFSMTPSQSVKDLPGNKNEMVAFRVAAESAEITGPFSDPTSATITPPPPLMNATNVQTGLTCPEGSSGWIKLYGIVTGADSIRYFVTKEIPSGEINVDGLQAEKTVRYGIAARNDTVQISNLGKGRIWILACNAVEKVGSVFSLLPVEISPYATLKQRELLIKPTTCDTMLDGIITLSTEGGHPAALTFYTDPPLEQRAISTDGRSVTYSRLAPGTYSIVVKDECGQDLTLKALSVARGNASIKASVTTTPESKPSGSDARMAIQISGGSGAYHLSVSLSDKNITNSKTNNNSVLLEKLGPGTYTVSITDAGAPCIKRWDSVVTIRPAAVVADSVTPTRPGTSFFPARRSGKQEPVKKAPPIEPEAPTAIRDTVKRRAASASFEQTDERLTFFGTGKRTSRTVQGYSEEDNDQQSYTIVIQKSRYQMAILNRRNDTLMIYPVVFGSADQGVKLFEGDKRTPEGVYHVREKREHAQWQKILVLDYPNADDERQFAERKSKGLIPADARIGNLIAIHGTRTGEETEVDRKSNWTDGCIATKNDYINELYKYIAVGTKVIIIK